MGRKGAEGRTDGRTGATDSGNHPAVPQGVLSVGLILMVIVAFVNYAATGIVMVTLPHRVVDLGGGDLAVGLIVGAMFISAVVCRPALGRFAGSVNRKQLVLAGVVVNVVCFTLYGVSPNLAALAVVRLLNGIGEACFYTGSATLVTDLAPPTRRSEAISYYSVAIHIGVGIGPTIGVQFADGFGLPAAFALAGGLCAASALLATALPAPPIERAPDEKRRWVSRAALLPGGVFALGTVGMAAFSAYVPLYGDDLNMSTVQYVFLLYSSVIVLVRLFGKVHRLDPVRVAQTATGLIALGLFVIAAAPAQWTLYTGTVVFAAGIAIQFPALMGIALRDAKDHERPGVVGTYTACQDLSQGLSGLLLGSAAYVAGYRASFGVAAACGLGGLLLLIVAYGRRASAPVPVVAAENPLTAEL
jgi:MFS family permease